MKACLFSAAVAALVSLASAQSIDNSAQQKALMSSATQLPAGQYTITNSDGTPMIYTRVGGQSYAPGRGSSSAISLESTPNNGMRMMMGNTKCISAQWGGKFDWAGVLYVCAIGSGPIVRGLAPLKQQWLFIPAGGSGVASVSRVQANAKPNGQLSSKPSTDKTTVKKTSTKKTPKKSAKALPKCKKTRTWLCKHPSYVKSRTSNHPECASLLSRCPRSLAPQLDLDERDFDDEISVEKRDVETVDLEKRASSNQYYIVALDHLGDMASRALTKGTIMTGDDSEVASWKLDAYQPGNSDQIFTVTPA